MGTRGLSMAVGDGAGKGGPLRAFRGSCSFLDEQQHPQEEARGRRGERSGGRGVFAHRPRVCRLRWRETAPLCRCCKPSIPGNPRRRGDQGVCRRTWGAAQLPDTQHLQACGLSTWSGSLRLAPDKLQALWRAAVLEPGTQWHPADLDPLPARALPVTSLPFP